MLLLRDYNFIYTFSYTFVKCILILEVVTKYRFEGKYSRPRKEKHLPRAPSALSLSSLGEEFPVLGLCPEAQGFLGSQKGWQAEGREKAPRRKGSCSSVVLVTALLPTPQVAELHRGASVEGCMGCGGGAGNPQLFVCPCDKRLEAWG